MDGWKELIAAARLDRHGPPLTPSGSSGWGFLTPEDTTQLPSSSQCGRYEICPPTPPQSPGWTAMTQRGPSKHVGEGGRPGTAYTHIPAAAATLGPASGPLATGQTAEAKRLSPSRLPRSHPFLICSPEAPHPQQPRGLTSKLLPPPRASRKYRFSPQRSISPGEAVSNPSGWESPANVFVSRTQPHPALCT